MKVLFLGHYREGDSGWSRAGQELITALDRVGVDIVCRPVILTGGGTPNETVLKCESKSVKNCDVVIQNLLPHNMVYNGKFKKNIAVPFIESYMDESNNWLTDLEAFDEIWTPSNHLNHTRLSNKVKKINIPTDLSIYEKNYVQQTIPQLYDDFVFYFIGDVNKRKNISSIIAAFHSEFTKYEPVSLVLKLNKFGMSEQELYNVVAEDVKRIDQSLRLYPKLEDYKPIVTITNRVPNEGIYAIHQLSNCFVNASHSEGWCLPLVDAFGFGSRIISTQYPYEDKLFPDSHLQEYLDPITSMHDTFDGQFTARDHWLSFPVTDLMQSMRYVYNLGKEKVKRDLSFLSYESVGQELVELLYS